MKWDIPSELIPVHCANFFFQQKQTWIVLSNSLKIVTKEKPILTYETNNAQSGFWKLIYLFTYIPKSWTIKYKSKHTNKQDTKQNNKIKTKKNQTNKPWTCDRSRDKCREDFYSRQLRRKQRKERIGLCTYKTLNMCNSFLSPFVCNEYKYLFSPFEFLSSGQWIMRTSCRFS